MSYSRFRRATAWSVLTCPASSCVCSRTSSMMMGKYAEEILEGDIHTANMKAFGLDDRSQAKVAIYCLVYGGSDARLGAILDKGAAPAGPCVKVSTVRIPRSRGCCAV